MVVAPLHLEVCTIISPTSSASAKLTTGSLLDCVETLPPDLMRRRFDPTGPGNLKDPFVAAVAIMDGWMDGWMDG